MVNELVIQEMLTHGNVDPDNMFSVHAEWNLNPACANARVVFKKANYDGYVDLRYQIALDIEAGGQGIKGRIEEDGTTHCALEMVVDEHASPVQKRDLKPLVDFIDAEDAYGSALMHLAPGLSVKNRQILTDTSIIGFYRGMKATGQPRRNPNDNSGDKSLIHMFEPIFKGFLSGAVYEQESPGEFCAFMEDVLECYTSEEDKILFADLWTVIDFYHENESLTGFDPAVTGSDVDLTSIVGIYRCYKAWAGDDEEKEGRIFKLFRRYAKGFRKNAKKLIQAHKLVDTDSVTILPCGQVALLNNVHNHRISEALAARGIRGWVYIDGLNMGARRENEEQTRLDCGPVEQYLRKIGEWHKWFRHPRGFLVAFGTKKAEATHDAKSSANPYELALALSRAIREHDAAQAA